MSQSRILKIGQQVFEHTGDLEWFEGAMLSLFLEPSKSKLYLLHWVDLSEKNNRWLFYPVSPRALRLYLEGKLSNQDVFFLDVSPKVKVVDLNGDFILHKIEEIEKRKLPADYQPSDDGYFQPEMCPALEKILKLLQQYPSEAGDYEIAMAA